MRYYLKTAAATSAGVLRLLEKKYDDAGSFICTQFSSMIILRSSSLSFHETKTKFFKDFSIRNNRLLSLRKIALYSFHFLNQNV